ncbi:Barley B recombinant-like protein B [Apostasia shenzhenica]|uniref:GAGA-binding transcriptional activator n=1 Tax=Apostasia shenzhenica TaxID=1088818 RepID=A0A2I0AKJ2_9ASPA|nr:Barley B recombinant-like protein B [Apostasia shenzhenica]
MLCFTEIFLRQRTLGRKELFYPRTAGIEQICSQPKIPFCSSITPHFRRFFQICCRFFGEIWMDDDGALGNQNWGGYFRPPPIKGNLGLQLMSSVAERDAKSFISGSAGGGGRGGRGFFHRECGVLEPSAMSVDFVRDVWYHNNRDGGGKMLHVFQGNHQQLSHHYGALLPETSSVPAAFQMMEQVEAPMEEKVPVVEESVPVKKRSKGQGRPSKASRPNKTKKANATRDGSANPSAKVRSVKKKMDMVINGIDLDLSGMPAPVCTCTGQGQQCYRWGAGGWQSACCTTIISMYPLPMSTKRRGTRIAGRKMSQGAFKKVLEKLAGEGQDFSSPIDLKPFWAKHGTNKFVTIR